MFRRSGPCAELAVGTPLARSRVRAWHRLPHARVRRVHGALDTGAARGCRALRAGQRPVVAHLPGTSGRGRSGRGAGGRAGRGDERGQPGVYRRASSRADCSTRSRGPGSSRVRRCCSCCSGWARRSGLLGARSGELTAESRRTRSPAPPRPPRLRGASRGQPPAPTHPRGTRRRRCVVEQGQEKQHPTTLTSRATSASSATPRLNHTAASTPTAQAPPPNSPLTTHHASQRRRFLPRFSRRATTSCWRSL